MHSSDLVLLEYSIRKWAIRSATARTACATNASNRNDCWHHAPKTANSVWSFVLEEQNGGTRLISRNRVRLPSMAARIGMVPMEPGSLIMERRMLRGIKQRAERLAAERKEATDV
jgi:hypothetical protein